MPKGTEQPVLAGMRFLGLADFGRLGVSMQVSAYRLLSGRRGDQRLSVARETVRRSVRRNRSASGPSAER